MMNDGGMSASGTFCGVVTNVAIIALVVRATVRAGHPSVVCNERVIPRDNAVEPREWRFAKGEIDDNKDDVAGTCSHRMNRHVDYRAG